MVSAGVGEMVLTVPLTSHPNHGLSPFFTLLTASFKDVQQPTSTIPQGQQTEAGTSSVHLPPAPTPCFQNKGLYNNRKRGERPDFRIKNSNWDRKY